MRIQDPLDRWLRGGEFLGLSPRGNSTFVLQARAGLDELARALADGSGRRRLPEYGLDFGVPVVLPDVDRQRAEALYGQVFTRGGPGSTFVQEGLLGLLGATGSAKSVPFWSEILHWKRPRDPFSAARRRFALAGMAHAACREDSSVAIDALTAACRDPEPPVRGEAVWYLSRVFLTRSRSLPDDVRELCRELASSDRAFRPRFLARRILAGIGEPAPLDLPGGAFTFEVRLAGDRGFVCRLALRSEQTLGDLHYAIQEAFEWDADHLHEFYLDGSRDDRRFVFGSTWDEAEGPDDAAACPLLGELGLPVGHAFKYFFDFGDHHEFSVKVVARSPQAEAAEHPHVVSRKGEPPPQYAGW